MSDFSLQWVCCVNRRMHHWEEFSIFHKHEIWLWRYSNLSYRGYPPIFVEYIKPHKSRYCWSAPVITNIRWELEMPPGQDEVLSQSWQWEILVLEWQEQAVGHHPGAQSGSPVGSFTGVYYLYFTDEELRLERWSKLLEVSQLGRKVVTKQNLNSGLELSKPVLFY